jgi:hypothetical protein
MKVTVPVGVPEPGAAALTTAVKLTDWPAVEEPDDEVSVVVVEAMLTSWFSTADVLGANVLSPL